MNDGKFNAVGRSGTDNNVKVLTQTTIEEGKITDIKVLAENSDQKCLGLVKERLIPRVIARQSLSVNAISSATLTSTAVLNSVEGAVKKAGGDPEQFKSEDASSRFSKSRFEEYDCDIVVIGAGGAGIVAAVTAAEAGCRVIVLEKTPACGGHTVHATEVLTAGHRLQREAGVTTTGEQIFNEIMSWNHWNGNSRLVSRWVSKTCETVDWLCEHNIPYAYTGSEQITHVLDTSLHVVDYDHRYENLKRLLETILPLGGKIFYETPAKELIQDENGRIVGVWALNEDTGYMQIHCKAVVISTGGYASNQEMAEKYFRYPCPYIMNGSVFTGDGINMAWAAGGDSEGLGTRVIHCTFPERSLAAMTKNGAPAASQFCRMPALLIVNSRGERFMNEYMLNDSGSCGVAITRQGDNGRFWVIFNEALLDKLRQGGAAALNIDWAPGGPGENYLASGFFQNLDADLAEAIQVGMIQKADTVEELAGSLHMVPAKLQATLDRYNALCEKKQDVDFYKKPELLHAISGGPYYAARSMTLVLCSLGGVRIDEKCAVLDAEMAPVSGLYCAGNDAGGIWDQAYGVMEGGTCSWAFNSGRIAGESAVEYVKS